MALIPDDLLTTKLFMPPARQTLVRRRRLIERLEVGLAGPLTLVIAPAGWGKTSLLADWLSTEQESAPAAAWLALDEQDNDLVRFLRYLIGAIQGLYPDLGGAALSRLQSTQPPAMERILTLVLNELAASPRDTVLVLDDYHVIETPAIHRALGFLLEHLPPQVHLVIATRADPPLPLARLRARGRLHEIRAPDLAFTTEEAARFLNEEMGLRLSSLDVTALEARTEGWIAGLHLAALTMRDRDPGHRRQLIAALSGTHRYILDFLAGEVFESQPEEVQRFLLSTSILGGLNGSLCDAVLGASTEGAAGIDGQAMLERLDAANLFIVRLDDTRTWYRYHHLFRDFLRERLRREHPELIPELHRRAARWLEASGRPAYAADHALSAEEYDDAARLIERVIGPMIWQRGEIMTLLRWLERLPRTATRTRPRLSLDLAWALLWSAQVDAVEPYLQDAELALEGDSVTSARAELGEVAAIRAELARQRGEIDTAIAMARRALADLPPDAQLVRAATSGLLAQAELLNGDARAAADAFAEAATLGELPHSLSLAMIAQGRLVQVQALQGLLHLAAVTYHQTIISAERYGMEDSPAVGVAQVYMADIRREWNDLAGAEELVRQGIARCTEWPGLAEMALDGYITLARLLQVRGDVDGAFANLDAAEILGRTAHVSQYAERIALTRARVSLLAGDEEGALGWARARESRPPDRVGAAYLDVLEGIMLARLHLVRGATEDALALLAGLLEAAEGGGLAGSAIEILLLRALCLQAQGQTAQAMVALSRALTLAEPQGYRRIFVDEGARMVRLLREARSRDVAGTYVHDLLRAADSAGAVPDDIPELVEPLSARELELLRLLASGLSTSEIAGQLFITPGTARNHLKSIFGKLDVHSRVQAVERARALRML